jgi:hypothetical protein
VEQKLTDRVAVLAGPRILMFQEVNNWGGRGTNTVRLHVSSDGSPEKNDSLKGHKNENFFGFDFEFCTISLLVMHKK